MYVSMCAYVRVCMNVCMCGFKPEMLDDLFSKLCIERLGAVECPVHHRRQRQQRLGVCSGRSEMPCKKTLVN